MRVCLVNTFHYRRGGDSTYAFDLAHLLESRGDEVVHFAMRHPMNEPSPFDPYFVSNVDYRAIAEQGSAIHKLAAFPRSLYSREARRKFASLLDDTKPDVVHLQNFRRHLTFSILPEAKKRSIPVVMTAHDYDVICPSSLLFAGGRVCDSCRGHAYYRAALVRCKDGSLAGSLAVALEGYFARIMRYYRLIDLIITPSRFAKSKMVECGRDERTIRVIPNFIDTSRYEPDYSNDGFIMASSRLSSEKGLDLLIAALGRLPETRLVIAGDGPCRVALEQLAVKLGLRNAEFIGYVARDRLLALVARARFVVMPSKCLENFPYSVLEAFALGKPVIASRMGGMPEMVVDGETGLLFESGDAAAMSEKIAYLERNADLVREMGGRARRRVETEFDSDTHYRSIRQAYDEAGH